ncbi:MAG: tyrosine recombinase [Alphaproteobacteria bacterium CG_4_10_14_0_8_um_filter_53_9]|nr:MAG: tyrosine recombinase [Alphaproteobacteria bacterium CG_4_10_14_0_8_um_filter_53_9]
MENIEQKLQAAREFWLGSEGKSPLTVAAYERDCRHFFTTLKTQNPTREDVENWLKILSNQNISPRSTARKLSSLRAFFALATTSGWVTKNPVTQVPRPKIGTSLPKALTLSQMKKLLEATTGETPEKVRLRLMLQLIYAAGLRVSELVTLTLNHTTSAEEEGTLIITGKGGKTRIIPLGDVARNTLSHYLKTTRKTFSGHEKGDWIFPSPRGGPLSRQRVFQLLQSLGHSVDIKLAPHHLRHTFATHLLDNEADLRSVQVMLGHASLNTTQIYTKVAGTRTRTAMERFHPLAK